MLWSAILFILSVWFYGFTSDIIGGLIHLLLIVTFILFIFQLMKKEE